MGRYISIKDNKLNNGYDFYDIYKNKFVMFKEKDKFYNDILVNPNNVVVKEYHNNKYYLPLYDLTYLYDKENLDIIINLDKDNKLYHEKIYSPMAQKNKTIIDQQFYKNLFKNQNSFKDNIKKDIKINYDIDTNNSANNLVITNFEGDNLELPEFTGVLKVLYEKESNNKKFNIIVPKGEVVLDSDTIGGWHNTKPKQLPVKIDIGIIDCSSIDLTYLDLSIFKINIDKLIIRDSRQSLYFPNGPDKYKIHIKELQILANEFIDEEIRYMTIDKITGNTEYLLDFKIKGVKHPNLFKNKTFYVIGTFRTFTNDGVKKRIEEAKGKINNKIDNSVDYLVVGGSRNNIECSSKYLEAKRLGIKMIYETQLNNWFRAAGVY